MIINLGNNLEAQVELVVTLDNISFWDYQYRSDVNIRNSQKINAPKRSNLGVVRNLIGDQNKWNFDLDNEQDEDISVELKLEWLVDGNLVATWIPGEATNGKIDMPANSHDDFSSRCKFFK